MVIINNTVNFVQYYGQYLLLPYPYFSFTPLPISIIHPIT